MNSVTKEQAIETYRRTVRDYQRYEWAMWVIAVNDSLETGEWVGGDAYPEFAKEVFEEMKKEVKKISMADEKDRP